MRLAPIEQIAVADDVVLFDDRVKEGHIVDKSDLIEIRGVSVQDHALILLGMTSGVWALGIDAAGKSGPSPP